MGEPRTAGPVLETAPHPYFWPPRRVLVGYEDADRSRSAWRVALEIARQHEGGLWVLHVVDLPHDAAVRMNPWERDTMVRSNLERFQGLVEEGAAAGVKVSLLVDLGHPVDRLAQRCSELQADVLVLGTLQQGPLLSWLEGSVSAKISPRVHVPILLVPSHIAPPQPHPPSAST